jgi:hypothetical protein
MSSGGRLAPVCRRAAISSHRSAPTSSPASRGGRCHRRRLIVAGAVTRRSNDRGTQRLELDHRRVPGFADRVPHADGAVGRVAVPGQSVSLTVMAAAVTARVIRTRHLTPIWAVRGDGVLRSRPLVTGRFCCGIPSCPAAAHLECGRVARSSEGGVALLVTLVPAARDQRLRNRRVAVLP